MAEIYTENDLAERVGGLLSAEGVSSELINSFDFKGTAEIMIKSAVPTWQSILDGGDEEKKEILRSCVAVQTAILLAPSLKKGDVKVRQTTYAKIEYFDADFDALLDSLYARLRLLYEQLGYPVTAVFPFVSITNREHRFCGAGFDI